MKPWIESRAHLLALHNAIEKYNRPITTAPKTSTTIHSQHVSDKAQLVAVKKIQHLWRGYKIKEAFVKDPYGAYLSMVAKDDEQRLLSSIMFGRHEAELYIGTKERLNNPYIHNSAAYHRCDNLAGELLEQLKKEFNLSPDMLEGKIMVPVTELNTVAIDDFMKTFASINYEILRQSSRSIAMVLVPAAHTEIKAALVSAGLIASPWEIAQNITELPEKTTGDTHDALYLKGLPNTFDTLLQSDLFIKLNRNAKNKRSATHQLAASLIQLIKNDDTLSPAAITRIALIIDMANTFYANNYPRYAFCVYAIIHELSLSIAIQTDTSRLDVAFKRFLSESKESLTQSLGLNEAELTNATFIASPALSGTNAFMIAKRIASTIPVEPGKKPSIKMYKPCYYELNTNEFSVDESLSDPDIFLFSTGPIVNMDGLTPGVDINLFIQENIIKPNRTKPTTLIIDATTTLYKNLHLNNDAKKLIQEGKLSIIVFESHQKFGLLHSDQAQYGRVFSVCATGMHDEAKLQHIQHDAQVDFNQHLDMRIGANINHCCKNTLEQIKQQHFSNGALFRTILNQTDLVVNDIVTHEYMSKNLEELYFITSSYTSGKFWNIVPFRNSFGHYSTTLSAVGDLRRLCANASDTIDSLIIASRIYLALAHRDETLIISSGLNFNKLSVTEQIITLGMAQNLITLYYTPQNINNKVRWYYALNNILQACQSLKGRTAFEEVSQYFYALQTNINATENVNHVLALKHLFDNNKTLNPEHCEDLLFNGPQVIAYLPFITSDEKQKTLLRWYINEEKGTAEAKLTSLLILKEKLEPNTNMLSILEEIKQKIDDLMEPIRQKWLQGFELNVLSDAEFPRYLFHDRAFMLELVKQNEKFIDFAALELTKNRSFVLEAVKQNPLVLYFVLPEFKNDKEIVLAAVKQKGMMIRFASPELQDNEAFILEVVKQNGEALWAVLDKWKGNRTIALAAIKNYGEAFFDVAPELREDSEFMLAVVAQSGVALLADASADLLSNKAFMLAAIALNGEALQYASDALQEEIQLMQQAQAALNIMTGFKKALAKIKPSNITEEQLNKIDAHIHALENETKASSNETAKNINKEHMDALEQFKTLCQTMDVSSALEHIETDDSFPHVNVGSRTHALMDEIRSELSSTTMLPK